GLGRYSHSRNQTHSEIDIEFTVVSSENASPARSEGSRQESFKLTSRDSSPCARNDEKLGSLDFAQDADMIPAIMTSQVLAGKVGVVFGVANKRSIAWAIAKAWAGAGARLIFNYQGERLKENVAELVAEFGENVPLFPCDVSSDNEIT